MVPDSVLVLDSIPLTTAGKTDIKALPSPVVRVQGVPGADHDRRRDCRAGVLRSLGVAQVGRDDDFFELGGNSLIATRVAARLGEALDTSVPVRALFEASTVQSLAVRLELQRRVGRHRPHWCSSPGQLGSHFRWRSSRMWFLNRFEPASAVNNVPAAIRISGALDVAALDARRDRCRGSTRITANCVSRRRRRRLSGRPRRPRRCRRSQPRVDHGRSPGCGRRRAGDSRLRRDVPKSRCAPSSSKSATANTFWCSSCITSRPTVFSMGPLTRDVMVAYEARTRASVPAWDAVAGAVRRLLVVAA